MRGLLIVVGLLGFPVSQLCGQTLQLPTFRSFGYSGSVLVPDGGSISLGGIGRASQAGRSSGWGPLRSRASGRSMSHAGLSAHVQIIDLAEIDRQLLGAEPQEFLRQQKAAEALRTADADASLQSAVADPLESAKQLVRDARRCIAKGNFRVADYYYRRAIEELPEDLATLAKQEYRVFLMQHGGQR